MENVMERTERADILTVTPQEDVAAREWWAKATEAEKLTLGRYGRSRRDLRWGAMSCNENRYIALELLNAGLILDDDHIDERENFREFVRTLPLMDDCAFTYEYVDTIPGHEAVIGATCAMVRNGKCYEGHGSDAAAAYGRMIQQIIAREA